MNDKNYIPLDIDGLFTKLNLTNKDDFVLLAKTLNQLEDEFIITHNKKGCFALLNTFNLAKGIIDIKDAGYGFVDLEDKSIFIKKDNLKGSIKGDEVLVFIYTDNLGRFEGKVERIIKRNTVEVVGVIKKYRNKYILKSVDKNLDLWVFIKQIDLKKAKENDFVKVKITKYYPNSTVDGEVIEIFGNTNTPYIDITSLVKNANVEVEFNSDVKNEVKRIPSFVDLSLYKNRKNLLDKVIVTIDGDDARDLDDAVRVEKISDNKYLLGVYIADVSEYVKELSNLDKTAFERSSSIYLPDRVIPMLPKELSNGICSLNENENRLVMCCEMVIDQYGKVVEYDIFEGIIKSSFRLTYNKVNEILNTNPNDFENNYKEYDKIKEMLYNMNDLSKILYNMRKKRGAFNFETDEAKIIVDKNGKAIDVVLRKRGNGEKMIEEFMLIANETVAAAMTYLDVPFIYRVHEEPKEDKITKLTQILNNFNYKFKIKNNKSMSKALQEILTNLESEEDEIKKTIINNTLLRSMMKAKYLDSNLGHYGLASDCYTHFTSPIRRYPDLLVHRLIKHYMLNEPQIKENSDDYFLLKVANASNYSSKQERKIESLERDVVDLKKCEYMEKYIYSTFIGIISSITNWGIYVTLENSIEGLIRFEDMNDDYYDVDELNAKVIGRRIGNIYQMGDKINIKVIDVNKEKRQILFKIASKNLKIGRL